MRLVFATNNRHKLEEVRAVLGDGVELVTPRELGITEDIPETADTLSGNALQKARYVFERVGGEARAVPSLRGTFGDVFAVFADDTGLEVDALGGAPGVYSARYAAMDPDFHGWSGACSQDPRPVATPGDGLTSHPLAGDGGAEIIGHPSYDDNCRLLLKNLEGVPAAERSARFRTVIALITGGGGGLGGEEYLFEGEVRGTIIEEYRGAGGFGYDPIFVPLCPENPRGLTFSEMSAEQKNAISHRARAVEKLAEFLRERWAKKQKNNETIR